MIYDITNLHKTVLNYKVKHDINDFKKTVNIYLWSIKKFFVLCKLDSKLIQMQSFTSYLNELKM